MKRVFKINHAAFKLTRYNQTEEIILTFYLASVSIELRGVLHAFTNTVLCNPFFIRQLSYFNTKCGKN